MFGSNEPPQKRTPVRRNVIWRARVLAPLLASVVVVAACGQAETADVATESAAAASEVIPTVSGGEIDFGSLEGTDTVLWFWAPW